MMPYYPNVDLVNDNVYTKFGKILSAHSQNIQQKTNSDVILFQICGKTDSLQSQCRSCHDYVYTEFDLILAIYFKDIEQKTNSGVSQGS